MAKPEPLSLQYLPVEILVKIFGELDIKHALRLAGTSTHMHDIFDKQSIYILLPILSREFSPLDTLLRIPGLSPEVFEDPLNTWCTRRIFFAGALVADEDVPGRLPEIHFRQAHVPNVMEIVKATSQWESAFPRLRFAELCEERRSLLPHEKRRLREALYNLWRYAMAFHQSYEDVDAMRLWANSPEQPDIRSNNLRTLSTTQLYELQDLWKTVRAAVATQLCPSVSLLLRNHGDSLSEDYLDLLAWGDGLENDLIVATVLRLRPDHLLSFLNHVTVDCTTSKRRVIAEFRSRHPTIERGHETLSFALRQVIRERMDIIWKELGDDGLSAVRFFSERNFPGPLGGILDDNTPLLEELREKFSSDGVRGFADDVEDVRVTFSNEPPLFGLLESSVDFLVHDIL